ncbi:ABC transporter ATP-binding protein [Caproiciproducens sp. MSJ-32]|uniref:ABC transporter ATP-binding protein n=1 Tax=Caproiciproducens sp. MSJ-32 TaxID=2841527 RepID=UPI001C1133DE|nr:ABC transporter ATP-binding protein [Caproiciproducens sp. MSJ-32]MBU5455526.1 ABC transporter ATP-binding protein/permease [Caproiciproducens sp. MSJ-32]
MSRHMGPGAHGKAHKAKDLKGTWIKLLKYSKEYIALIIIAIICAIGGTIFTIIGPDKLKEITNVIMEGVMTEINLDKVGELGITLVIFYVTGAILSYTQQFILTTVTQRVANKLRRNISEKMNKIPLKYFDSTSHGDILSRITNDVDIIGQSMNQSIGTLVSAISLFIGSLIMMFKNNVSMSLAAIVATIIGFILMTVIMGKSQKYFASQQKELGQINGHIEEIYSAHNIVKVYNGEDEAINKFEEINERLFDSARKSQFLSGLMMPLMAFIGNFGYVAVCVVGAILAFDGKIEFGVIVAFMVYVRLFTQPLSQMGQAATSLQSAAAAGERVFEFLEQEELEDESHKTKLLKDVKGDVEFKNVKFGYNPDKLIIKNFSMKAKAGQKVAIVGPTGAGKTTIVNLLMRFYETNSGQILIDGVDTKSITRENVHDLFCMVLQDTWLFEASVRDNIVYNKTGVTDEEVINACKAVGIHHFIMTLPHGYDTILDDKINLSAGQKQLLTIARAMVENAPLLILDEATSSVDTRTELLIQEAMDRLTVGRTSFVIAHRLSTIKNADLILVMKDGDIIESGNHNELLEKGGFYAELYNSQFEQVEA